MNNNRCYCLKCRKKKCVLRFPICIARCHCSKCRKKKCVLRFPICVNRCCSPCPPGPPGPPGESGVNVGCACFAQMRNIIEQIIATFSTSNLIVNIENGGSASGRPNSILNGSYFVLTNAAGNITDRISICKITSISLTGTNTFTGFTFLPAPDPLPVGCDAQCESGARNILQSFVGTATNVNIRAGGNDTGNKSVTSTAFGVAILGNEIAVSTCQIEDIR